MRYTDLFNKNFNSYEEFANTLSQNMKEYDNFMDYVISARSNGYCFEN